MDFFSASESAGGSVSKKDYKSRVPELRTQLLGLQRKLKKADFPVLILISGVDGAGKRESVNLLNEWMDPRFLQTFAFGPKSDEELQRPEFWRFWRSLPSKGEIGLYVGSWYSDPIALRLQGFTSRKIWLQQMGEICRFEKMLVDDGALIIKFWLHLSKEHQIERMEKLSADPTTAWRVTDLEREHLRIYDRFRQLASETLELTTQAAAPWQVIYGRDQRHLALSLSEEIYRRIQQRLKGKSAAGAQPQSPGWAEAVPADASRPAVVVDRPAAKSLKQLHLDRIMEKDEYQRQLELQQGRLNTLSRQAWQRGIASILLFEGWDAAGKGGIIRRIIAAMDARQYRVIPIAAPSAEEHKHHYLWRFWKYIPGAGRVAVFDRSWYGRVLVERIEGFATVPEWRRGYDEIRDFESQLLAQGIVLMKYWVHISEQEQLARFRHREETPHKQFKITEEDYRNRQRWSEYEVAVNEMVANTDTAEAPWLLIEGNDKRYARIKALSSYCDRLQLAIDSHVL